MVKKTKKAAVKKSLPSTSATVEKDDLVRELVECGAALEKRVAELEMKVASLERGEHERLYPPARNSFSFQSSR